MKDLFLILVLSVAASESLLAHAADAPFREAVWIGLLQANNEPPQLDVHFAFRKRVDFAERASATPIRITADNLVLPWNQSTFTPLVEASKPDADGWVTLSPAHICGSGVNCLLTSFVLGIRPTAISRWSGDETPPDRSRAKPMHLIG